MTCGDKLWSFRTFCQPEASEPVDTQRQIMVILHLFSSRGGEPNDMQRQIMVIVATYPSVGGRHVTRGCVFQERNTRGVATTIYLRKTSEKPEKDVIYEL